MFLAAFTSLSIEVLQCGHSCTLTERPFFTVFPHIEHVCDDPECIEKARIARGGPGGHMKRKAEGLPILPDDLQ